MKDKKQWYLRTARTYCMMSGDGERTKFLDKARNQIQLFRDYVDMDVTDPYSFESLHTDLWGEDDKQAA